MKDPIHTNNIYVGVAWFCHRSFLFFLRPLNPPTSSSSSAVSCGDAVCGAPAPLGVSTHGRGSQPSHAPRPLGQALATAAWGTRLQGLLSPHAGQSLMARSQVKFPQDPYSIRRQKPSSGTVPVAARLPRLWKWHPPILHPSSPAVYGPREGRVRSWSSPMPCLWFHVCLMLPFC